MKTEIYPSILAHTFEEYTTRLELIEMSDAQWAHVDIMDGQFVPNISVMPHEIMSISSRLKFEVHIMAQSPERYFSDLTVMNCGRILIHREVSSSAEQCAELVRRATDYVPEVTVVYNPETDLESVSEFGAHGILVMGVHPGQSGQPLLDGALDRVKQARNLNPTLTVEVDGGVNEQNITDLQNAGANRFVIASHLFVNNAVSQNYKYFSQLVTGGA